MIEIIEIKVAEDIVKSFYATELDVDGTQHALHIMYRDFIESSGGNGSQLLYIIDLTTLAFSHYYVKSFQDVYLASLRESDQRNCLFKLKTYQINEFIDGLLIADGIQCEVAETPIRTLLNRGGCLKIINEMNELKIFFKSDNVSDQLVELFKNKIDVRLRDLTQFLEQYGVDQFQRAIQQLKNNKIIYQVEQDAYIFFLNKI